jgi:glutaconate CoA-transferase subunit A
MESRADKGETLAEVIEHFVTDGCHLSIGGFTLNRNPMAAVYEIIRQQKRNLHLYAHSNGQGVDELIGAGCVSRLEIAYGGTGRFAPTCVRFKKAVQSGAIEVEDYSNYQMTLRFLAGAMGVPFLPTRSSLGTSIIDKWGFPEGMRRSHAKIPDRKLVVQDNPFFPLGDAKKLVLVPAINPDVTIIHVQQADTQGTLRIKGLSFADIEQAKAACHLIVTCEELVDTEVLRRDSDQNQIPFFYVDRLVCIPWGAYPTACYGFYDYDPVYLNDYRQKANDDQRHQKYLKEWVHGVKSQEELIDKVGSKRLSLLHADPETGYATHLDRK